MLKLYRQVSGIRDTSIGGLIRHFVYQEVDKYSQMTDISNYFSYKKSNFFEDTLLNEGASGRDWYVDIVALASDGYEASNDQIYPRRTEGCHRSG